jgi:lipid-A-disaccharide synthase
MRSEERPDDAAAQGTVLFTAFEPSGDAHAAPVIAALRRRAPGLQVVGWGGPRMEAAGATIIERSADDGAMGLSAISRIGAVRAHQAAIARWSSAHRVSVHVPVDSPAANFPVARSMKSRGVRVCHLVAPQLWAWAPWRIRKLRRSTDLLLCLLPFEERWFRERHVPARFIGHPVINRAIAADAAARAAELPPGAPRILILPGSRSSEVRANLAVLMRALSDLQARFRKLTAVIVAANDDLLALVRERLGGTLPSGVNLISGQLDAAIAWSDLALCVSGTVSLDLTRQARPMVAVYKVSPISWLGARLLLTTPHRLLPNILAGDRIVPEFVPHMGGAAPISKVAEQMLTDQKRLRQSADGLRRVLAMYQGHDPAQEAADAILTMIRGGNPLLNPSAQG